MSTATTQALHKARAALVSGDGEAAILAILAIDKALSQRTEQQADDEALAQQMNANRRKYEAEQQSAAEPIAHIHSTGEVCVDRMPKSDVWPVDLFAHPPVEETKLRDTERMDLLERLCERPWPINSAHMLRLHLVSPGATLREALDALSAEQKGGKQP